VPKYFSEFTVDGFDGMDIFEIFSITANYGTRLYKYSSGSTQVMKESMP
jgi:hypothetical protein